MMRCDNHQARTNRDGQRGRPRVSGSVRVFLVTVILLRISGIAQAQQAQQDTTEQTEMALPLEGETGVAAGLEEAYEERESVFGAPLQRYLDWKERLRDRTGFSYSLMGLWLYHRVR